VPAVQDAVRTLALASAFAAAVLGAPGTAAAHVIVSPDSSEAGQTQLYAIAVPSEKQSTNTVKVEVQFPRTLVVLQLQAPAGWTISPEKDGAGRILGAVFEGGRINSDEFASFGVLAQNPNTSSELVWTAIQSYADGSEVQWVGPEVSQFPASVTHVRSPGIEAWLPAAIGGFALAASLAALGVALLAWRRARRRATAGVASGRSASLARRPADVA
jgi:uncharacterized protein YcnI